MIADMEQLHARAGELALMNALDAGSWVNARFWSAFESRMSTLRDFARRLTENRVECSQPAEDWLLDHMAFLETQAQEVHRTFSRRTLRQLPMVGKSNVPRIMAICDDYLEHVDGHYDVTAFENYVNAYQEVSVLSLLECTVLPNAMRAVIIRRLAKVMDEVASRYEVCRWTSSVLSHVVGSAVPNSKVRSILDQETDRHELTPTEMVHLLEHVNEWEEDGYAIREWLMLQIENSDRSLPQMEHYEQQLQAELQVTTGNLVQSLHLLEQLPWEPVFKRISHVEHILGSQPDSEYVQLDEASQGVLRQRVADLARQLRVPETLLAHTVVRLASRADTHSDGIPPRDACIAFYLLEPNGEIILRKELRQIVHPRHLWALTVRRHPWLAYLSSGTLVFIILVVLKGLWVSQGTRYGFGGWLMILAVLTLPASEWVVNVVHSGIARSLRPTILLRYDFSDGLPADAATMVAVPVIWSTPEEINDVLGRLVVHYLANRQDNIYFAVLADFADSPVAEKPEDKQLLNYAQVRIQEIRAEYGRERFFLLHRERRHNHVEGVHMGWERKRGKLIEFVELLAGEEDTSYTLVDGDIRVLRRIRYVCTVDHDTELPIGVVSRLAGTIHLPYNRPRLNASGTRVVEGYGVLEPRVGVSLESAQSSRFAELWAGDAGIDPYAFAVSDPYQNLFGSAMFVGKGIFDVEVFLRTLTDRVPENRVLSHDYLEGGFLRTGLTPDIEIVEEHPDSYFAYQRRAHRWIRGDWQLLTWLWPTVRNRAGERTHVDLPALTRWQIFDSLRRSLVTPALFLLALLGVTVLPGERTAWEMIVVLTVSLPFWRSLVQLVLEHGTLGGVRTGLLQSLFKLITLPFDAVVAADAIGRTLYRLFISQKRLLEWATSAQTNHDHHGRQVFLYEPFGYLLTVGFTIGVAETAGKGGTAAAIVLAVLWWMAHPVIGALSRPHLVETRDWVNPVRPNLEQWAQQIWSFYEDYVTAEESWLPPDNVQFRPKLAVAHRTSPTNIGLYLASVLAARDLGIIDTASMVRRLEMTVQTLHGLEKWHGHLYNWYDTKSAQPLTPRYVSTVDSGNLIAYLMVVCQGLKGLSCTDRQLRARIQTLIRSLTDLIDQTDFRELYSFDEHVFCIGYHVDMDRRETIRYDLLASEARQASFVAIALGKIPVSHWFRLGRTMTIAHGNKTLLSWSGTMFEYLMPSLVMRTYRGTLWDSTFQGVVARQAQYANERKVPFGISESGYFAFDYQLNYQYRAFGVPGLGFSRGLEQNLVVAPYAAMMALPFAKQISLHALAEYEAIGAKGRYGFYEAVDFTASRLNQGSNYEVIQSFMAHHQGMSLLVLTNLLLDDIMIERFHTDPRVRAARLLLQERVPAKPAIVTETLGVHAEVPELGGNADEAERTFSDPPTVPEVNVLSNGSLTSILGCDGSGRIIWKGISVTRWRADPLLRSSGMALYIRDAASEATWTPMPFPGTWQAGHRAVFRLDKTLVEARSEGIWSGLEVAVAPDFDAEIRRLKLVNETGAVRTLEVSSFLELALAPQNEDIAHPAFQKLFVQTEHDPSAQCLLARRRPRQPADTEMWAVHTVYVDGPEAGEYEYETDRAAFIGRGHSLMKPIAMPERLRGTMGAVTDPAFVMHRTIRLMPHSSVTVYIITGMAEERERALDIVRNLREPSQADRQFHLAWMRARIDLRHLHLTAVQAQSAQMLAGRILYAPPFTTNRLEAIERNTLGQSGLWAHGISGDLPIITIAVKNLVDLRFLKLLTREHQYLWSLGIASHLIVLDETSGGYQDDLMHQLRDALAARGIGQMHLIIGLKAEQLSPAERNLLAAVSAVWLSSDGPSLRAQLSMAIPNAMRRARERRDEGHLSQSTVHPHFPLSDRDGEYFNGWGSFVDGGKAYRITVRPGEYLPRPWSNIIANPNFGCVITELGTGYTWWHNAREFKLTPWSNDPVLDAPGEVLYLRNLDSHELWSATPSPCGGNKLYQVTHGFGYTRVEQTSGDTVHTMEVTVSPDDPVKVVCLTLTNRTTRIQHIAVSYYAEWVLGVSRESTGPYIVSDWDEESQSLFAHNTYQEQFRDAVAFLHLTKTTSYTADQAWFLGDSGSDVLAFPIGLTADKLSGRTGAFANSCGVVQSAVDIPPGGQITLHILIGCTDSETQARVLVDKYTKRTRYRSLSAKVRQRWADVTEGVKVQTPDRAFDILLNGWLLYQTLVSRMWGRTGFYQAGGAYGFRDQLQDALALLHTDASLTRKQILLHAAHQYEEGDVQHWWHEETRKGIRTRYSDDLLWLPYVISRYVEHTGDTHLLDELTPFLHSPTLAEGERERYEDTVVSSESASLLEHCLRAIRRASHLGPHGLPLMGTGDWNDGMNEIGPKGIGESVWLGWFLLDVLKRFVQLLAQLEVQVSTVPSKVQRYQTDPESSTSGCSLPVDFKAVADEFSTMIQQLQAALNQDGWDGAWFRRAFTDDGRMIGSMENRECRMDAIAQSFAVISNGTSRERQLRAMRSFDRELVDRHLNMVKLLARPFDQTKPSPGYIQGYPPGIRENGGQYTHGAIWSVIAWAMLGESQKAYELFTMLSPITHTLTSHEVMVYGNEPYVMSADVYSALPHVGRAGWSWYTGSASWMYQAGLEYILGVQRRGNRLFIAPCVPLEWESFSLQYRFGQAHYVIRVECRPSLAEPPWVADGVPMFADSLELRDDEGTHQVIRRIDRHEERK